MTDASYFTDRAHVAIYGVTGARTDYGGKTALANWWASTWGVREFDLVVFLNFKGDDSVKGTHVSTWAEIGDALERGDRHLNVEPTTADWEGFHAEFRQFVDELPRDMSKLVVHDEAPEYDTDSLLWFVRVAGNRASCKSLVIAQEPVAISPRVRSQCIPAWVGPVTEENEDWFRSKSYTNHYAAIDAVGEPYHWYVFTGPGDDDLDHYKPVPAEYA